MQALLELDCIPSGMELFPAANEDQWTLIKEVIDECDYYIVILGGRYGSTDGDGVSFTEKEYRYALETEKPIIGFLHEDISNLSVSKSEQTDDGKKKLQEFRELVQSKVCKFWATPETLGSVVSRSLINLQRRHPGVGWIRGDVTTDKEASAQIVRLTAQLDKLRTELDTAMTTAPPGTEKLSQGDDYETFSYEAKTRCNGRYFTWDLNTEVEVTWNKIFYELSPLMIHEASDRQLKHAFHNFLTTLATEDLEDSEESAGHFIQDLSFKDSEFQTVKIQLRALGLIKKSDRSRSVKDTSAYWTLTPYGDEVMNRLRAKVRKNI